MEIFLKILKLHMRCSASQMRKMCNTFINHLKSLRSVQISILKPKKYPRSSKDLSVL